MSGSWPTIVFGSFGERYMIGGSVGSRPTLSVLPATVGYFDAVCSGWQVELVAAPPVEAPATALGDATATAGDATADGEPAAAGDPVTAAEDGFGAAVGAAGGSVACGAPAPVLELLHAVTANVAASENASHVPREDNPSGSMDQVHSWSFLSF